MERLLGRRLFCAYCGRSPRAICSQCGRSYCERHGAERCAACTTPERFLPSPLPFRLALGLLPLSVILSVWFLLAARVPAIPEALLDAGRAQVLLAPLVSPTASPSLTVPASSASPTVLPLPSPSPAPLRPATYVVESGDTLWDIASRFGTTLEILQSLNNLPNPHTLEVGQVLRLPSSP